jgi:hypothetical protein
VKIGEGFVCDWILSLLLLQIPWLRGWLSLLIQVPCVADGQHAVIRFTKCFLLYVVVLCLETNKNVILSLRSPRLHNVALFKL